MTSNAQSNTVGRDEYEAQVREFGRLAAQGKDSLPMLAVATVRASANGYIDTVKDANGVDDAHRVYSEYAKANSKKAVHEHTKDGVKANASKVRQFIEFGALTTCDPIDVLNRAIVLRKEMVAAEEKVRPAYHGYLEVARTQKGVDRPLTDDELKHAVRKPAAEDKTEEGELEKAHKILDRLVTGEGGVKSDSLIVVEAHKQVGDRLNELKFLRERDELVTKAAMLGVTIVTEPEVEMAA